MKLKIKSITLFYILSLLLFNCSNSQTWKKVGSDLKFNNFSGIKIVKAINNELYIAGGGGIIVDGNDYSFAKFDGINWTTNIGYQGGVIYSIEYYKNKLYVGGNFDGMNNWNDGIENLASWNGTSWEKVGWLGNPDKTVYALQAYKNKLYLGGIFHKIGNQTFNLIASFDGSNYSDLGPLGLDNYYSSEVTQMAVFKNQLSVAGYFEAQDVYTNSYASWDGTAWHGSNNLLANVRVATLAYDAINNALYAGGLFYYPPKYIAENYGYGWGEIYFNHTAGALCIYNNNLYFGLMGAGVTDTILYRYDGETFHPIVGPIADPNSGAIWSMAVWGDTLYVGGSFKSVNGDTTMAYFAAYYDTTRGHLRPGVGINEVISDSANYLSEAVPNPARLSIKLKYKLSAGNIGEIKIFSILGNLKQSHTVNSQNESIEIDISGWHAGTYAYSLFVDEEFKGSRKFVVQ